MKEDEDKMKNPFISRRRKRDSPAKANKNMWEIPRSMEKQLIDKLKRCVPSETLDRKSVVMGKSGDVDVPRK
mgnify:CR=1 FL=1